MKKLFVGIIFLLVSSFAFAEVFKNGEKIVTDFFEKGFEIKVIEDENNIKFISKSTVSSIAIDEDDIKIAFDGYDLTSGKYGNYISFYLKKWSIESDEKGNIIIIKLPS